MTSPRPRVLLVTLTGDNRWTGMGKWTHEMADGLRRLGYPTQTWFADDFPRLAKSPRLAVLGFPPALAAELWRRRDSIDVAVIHEPSGFWSALIARLAPGAPRVIAMCHNVESRHLRDLVHASRLGLADVSLGTRVRSRLVRRWQSDGAIKLATGVVCLSSVDRAYIRERLGRRGSVVLQTNGAPSVRGERGLRGGANVLFVGGWLDTKGCRVLPALWAKVIEARPEARLTLVGTGLGPSDVLRDFPVAVHSAVQVVPRVTDEGEMLAAYGAHDIFLMPSLSEGSPLSLLEAMAGGLVVVAARVGGIPDLVSDAVEGALFDPADPGAGARQVLSLIEDPTRARALALAAQKRACALTWEASTLTLAAAIDQAWREQRSS